MACKETALLCFALLNRRKFQHAYIQVIIFYAGIYVSAIFDPEKYVRYLTYCEFFLLKNGTAVSEFTITRLRLYVLGKMRLVLKI